MKPILLPVALWLVLAVSSSPAAAEVTSKISDVHLCCKGCVDGVNKAVSQVDGAKATVDSDAGTVTLSGADKATVQKAADALDRAMRTRSVSPRWIQCA